MYLIYSQRVTPPTKLVELKAARELTKYSATMLITDMVNCVINLEPSLCYV